MKTKIETILFAIICWLGTAIVGLSATNAPPPPPALTGAQPKSGRFYTDAGLSLTTSDFQSETFGYFAGVGYQVSKVWGFDVRATHEGLDASGAALQAIGGRLVARMPFEFLSPYTFLGGEFDLEQDRWYIQPGAGIEIGVSKRLKGLSIFTEGALRADTEGSNSYLFTGGVRLRF